MRISDWSSDVCSSDLVGSSGFSLRSPSSILASSIAPTLLEHSAGCHWPSCCCAPSCMCSCTKDMADMEDMDKAAMPSTHPMGAMAAASGRWPTKRPTPRTEGNDMHASDAGYGLWLLAAITAAFFIFFAWSFYKPLTRWDWRGVGMFSVFVVALFAEMYGFPPTLYVLGCWLIANYPQVNVLRQHAGDLVE